MSARDIYHPAVKVALEKYGWSITSDPLTLDFQTRQLHIDLGAERLIAAQKENEKIAVEVKSFLAPSAIAEFHTALGQFLNYRVALRQKEPNRVLFLAVPIEVYESFFSEELAQLSLKEYQVKLLVFNPQEETITLWKD
jgi:hypothetical protein